MNEFYCVVLGESPERISVVSDSPPALFVTESQSVHQPVADNAAILVQIC